ncbi:GNAT family N-acetyltransferase [Halalkalibacterium ligniniphilum]|uniref:GNAT family N-acetyltransferase n=1 Tax=Halalkalibacterium ligniniphilum TaxID=1134413 RepID=UPI00034ACD5C|nr:GNAT family N-acetyltransferase [Halalkalibacterium ligniniphilum]
MHVEKVKTEKQLQDAFQVRTEVFVHEQKVPQDIEIDEHEDEATHFVLYEGNAAVGAGRLRVIDNYGKMERICISKTVRGTGAGRLLMETMEAYAKEQGLEKAKLNAQIQAEGFYKKLGYVTVSDPFLDANIPHVTMIKALS